MKGYFQNEYAFRIRVITLGVVAALTLTLFSFPKFIGSAERMPATTFDEMIEEISIPETHQFQPPPPPPRPSIPVESETEDLAEDITIDETDLDEYTAWDVPPLEAEDTARRVRFIAHDQPPEPIGGYEAIIRYLEYPPIARQAGLEGTVVLQVFVNKNGVVEDVIVMKSIPGTGFDEAASKAIKKIRFLPAKQRDRALGVWVAISIHFQLRGTDS